MKLINNLSQNSTIEQGTLAIGRNLLGLLGTPKGFPGPQKGFLDFHHLVKSKLALHGANRIATSKPEKTVTDWLPFMSDLLPGKLIEMGHQPLGRAELGSLQEIVTTIKDLATKVGRPIALKINSKTIGEISLQIDPAKNQLTVTLAAGVSEVEKGPGVKETLLAELATIFDSIKIAIPDHKPGLLTPPSANKAQPLPISQPDAVKIIENFMAMSDETPLFANLLTTHLDLDVEAVGNVAVDLSGEANKTSVQLRTSSTKTLKTLKIVLLKSDFLSGLEIRESGRELKISKKNVLNLRSIPETHFISRSDVRELGRRYAGKSRIVDVISRSDVEKPVVGAVSTKAGFEIIRNAVDSLRRLSKTAGAANKETVHLKFESLGEVKVEIESHRGKADIKVQVESPLAREVFKDRLTAWQPQISNVKISVRNKTESLSPQRETGIVSVIGTKHGLTASKALQTVQRVLDATTVSRAEGLESRVRFTIPAKSLGEITVDLENTKKQPRLQVTVSSNRARRGFAARFGQKVKNMEIRVENHRIDREANPQDMTKVRAFKGLDGQFKLNSKLTPSQAIQTIQEVLGSVSQPEAEVGQSKVRLQLTVEKFGPLAVEITKDVDGAHLQLRTDSTQARDWLNQHLRRAGLKVEEIKTVDNKKGLMLRVEAPKPDVGLSPEHKTDELGQRADAGPAAKGLMPRVDAHKPEVELSPEHKTEEFGQGADTGPAAKGLHGLLEVLFGPAKTRPKLPSKRDAISANQVQRSSSTRKTENLRKAAVNPLSKFAELPEDENDTIPIVEDFKGRQLSGKRIANRAESTEQPVEVETIPHSETRPAQPVLTLGNVHFDLVGNKMIGLSKVERSALPEMIQRILEFGNLRPNSLGQKLQVQLEVAKIGKLLVDAVKYKDKINLHVNVENADVRRLLETQLRPLIDQMFKEGIEVGKLEVSVREQNSESGPDWQAADNDRSFASEQNSKDAPGSFYPKETDGLRFRQRDFGYNSMEVLA